LKKALIAAALALPLGVASCSAIQDLGQGTLTEEQVKELNLTTARLATLEQSFEQIEDQAQAVFEAATSAVKGGRIDELGIRLTQLLELQEDHQAIVAQYQDVVEEERALLKTGVNNVIGGILGTIQPFLPAPIMPLVPLASSLGVMLFSKRGREHGGKALKAAAKGNLGEMLASVLRAAGAKHSNETTEGVLGGAIYVAEQQVAKGEIPMEALQALRDAQAKLSA